MSYERHLINICIICGKEIVLEISVIKINHCKIYISSLSVNILW